MSESKRFTPETRSPVLLKGRLAFLVPWHARLPGVLMCAVITMAATFLSEHSGGPQLLFALLIGLSFHFVMEQPGMRAGVEFCSKTLLRLGVALLGMRITASQITGLGLQTALVVVFALVSTILVGWLLARLMGQPAQHGILSGGAVAICGASAAMAISSLLPHSPANERFTLLTVVGVTLLSTCAMVLYPWMLAWLALSPAGMGTVLGGTIHDVAQVVGAGALMGEEQRDVATVVKLFRVMLLMPVAIVLTIIFRRHENVSVDSKPVSIVPGFLLGFVVLVLLGSTGIFTVSSAAFASEVSRNLLVMAIAAAGVKTTFKDLLELGWRPLVMLLTETVYIGAVVTVLVWKLE